MNYEYDDIKPDEYGSWGAFLTSQGYCKKNIYTGNRPCDSGHNCDKCHHPTVRKDFETWKKSLNI